MYSRLLIATDGSELAGQGLDHGLALARRLGAEVVVLTATEPFPVIVDPVGGPNLGAIEIDEYQASQAEFAGRVLAEARAAAERMGVTVDTVHLRDSQAAEAIVTTARARDCDLIVMSSHGRRGLRRLILGSQTAEVLTQSEVPVLVVRQPV